LPTITFYTLLPSTYFEGMRLHACMLARLLDRYLGRDIHGGSNSTRLGLKGNQTEGIQVVPRYNLLPN
jgi:hypothetical protein